ncbi:MAG: hypothetical protein AABZ12_03595 [Planctomycetota bacterium]
MPSGLNIRTRLDLSGDRDLFTRVSKAFRNPRDLMRKIGVLGMSSAVRRLQSQIAARPDTLSSGRLMASLTVARDGGSRSAETIFDLSDQAVEIGSHVRYAAQRQYGGIILPVHARALAIPLTDRLKRDGIGPREADPSGKLLRFQPILRPTKPNVVGLLIDDGGEIQVRDRRGRMKTRRLGGTAYGPGPLYVLAYWVRQDPRPFLYWDEEDLAVIRNELIPQWLEGK